MNTQERVVKALARGPLYDGLLTYVSGVAPKELRRVLRQLEKQGAVRRDGMTWYLIP